eukprot:685380-Hanusia_phi.AAC.1
MDQRKHGETVFHPLLSSSSPRPLATPLIIGLLCYSRSSPSSLLLLLPPHHHPPSRCPPHYPPPYRCLPPPSSWAATLGREAAGERLPMCWGERRVIQCRSCEERR